MQRKVPAKVKRILSETRRELEKIYADRLKEMILFGSYARGDFGGGSDIDIILLLERIKDTDAEKDRYLPVVTRLSLKYDTVISVIPFKTNEFRRKRTSLILNVRKEGIRV